MGRLRQVHYCPGCPLLSFLSNVINCCTGYRPNRPLDPILCAINLDLNVPSALANFGEIDCIMFLDKEQTGFLFNLVSAFGTLSNQLANLKLEFKATVLIAEFLTLHSLCIGIYSIESFVG